MITELQFDLETYNEKMLFCLGWIKRGMSGKLYTHEQYTPYQAVNEERAINITLSNTGCDSLSGAYSVLIAQGINKDPKLDALRKIRSELDKEDPDLELLKLLVQPY